MESRSGSRLRMFVALLATAGWVASAHAVNFGNMMNPGSWFGNNNNSRDDGAYGYGPGYGYGSPGYGYGAAPYGYPQGGVPYGYGQPPAAVPAVPATPPTSAVPAAADDSDARIKALEQRIKELEAAQRQPPSQSARSRGYSGTPLPMQSMPRAPQSAPANQPVMPSGGSPTFRPLGQQ